MIYNKIKEFIRGLSLKDTYDLTIERNKWEKDYTDTRWIDPEIKRIIK